MQYTLFENDSAPYMINAFQRSGVSFPIYVRSNVGITKFENARSCSSPNEQIYEEKVELRT